MKRLALTLEAVLTGHGYADLDASPLQLAIARAADGRDLDGALGADAMSAHFGVTELPPMPVVALVVLVCGVRSGKSFLAACAAIKGCLTADLSKLKCHEVPRFAIVAPTVDNANATFRILAGIIHESPTLARLVVKETGDELLLRRLDGRLVEIVVVAAHRGAITMRSRWLIGFVLEEVAGFGEEVSGAAVTGEEVLRAGETRLVPGSQGWIISSPFGPTGMLWELYKAHFGKPGRVLVVHAPTVAMNPSFDPAQVEAVRQRDPDTAAREYDAQWLDASTTLLSAAGIDRCTRRAPAELPRETGHYYVAAMDAATRGNSWTLVIMTRKRSASGGIKDVVVCAKQWTGSKSVPLDPKGVLVDIAATLKRWGLSYVWADEYGSDFVKRLAYDCELQLCLEGTSSAQRLDRYQGLAMRIANGDIEFPPDEVLRRDLLGIKKVARQGSVQIVLPHTPDGRHADYAPSIVMALHKRAGDPEDPSTLVKSAWEEHWDPLRIEDEGERRAIEGVEEREQDRQREAQVWRDLGFDYREERRR